LSAEGFFRDGEFTGIWKFMNDDGSPHQEANYRDDQTYKILNAWDRNGNPSVRNGTGKYISYHDGKNKLQEGQVEEGSMVGLWTTYYLNGKIKEVGEFRNDKYIIKSAWNEKGEMIVKDGTGAYVTYFEDSTSIAEQGEFKDGLREGKWLVYYPHSTVIQQESSYLYGMLSGSSVTYFANGNVLA
jgi:uncharacterized protein